MQDWSDVYMEKKKQKNINNTDINKIKIIRIKYFCRKNRKKKSKRNTINKLLLL